MLDMPENVLDHHDCVIDDESDRNGHRHQREIVQGVMAEIHAGESGRQRQGHSDAGNERRPEPPQKQEDDHDDEGDAQRQ
jgi:hypothetical protein